MRPVPPTLEGLAAHVASLRRHTWRPGVWKRRLTRNSDWSATADEKSLTVDATCIPIHEIDDLRLARGLVWWRVTIKHRNGTRTTLGGMTKRDAKTFVKLVNAFCVLGAAARLRKLVEAADQRQQRWHELLASKRWLAQSEVARFIAGCPGNQPNNDIKQFLERPYSVEAMQYFEPQQRAVLQFLYGHDLQEAAARRNERFVEEESRCFKAYFDTVEANPLTDEQRRAVVTFDDNVMTVAAAGSGKTSVMVAKAGYAIKTRLYKPEEILLLAFNRDAAEELAERVLDRLGPQVDNADRITVATFHSIGLSTIGKATGARPNPAPWLESGRDIAEMVDIVETLCERRSFADQWNLFKSVYATSLPPFGTKQEPEFWDPETGIRGYLTNRGETVKSHEERTIANWLAYQGIEYEYERAFEWPQDATNQTSYHPDFWYPSANVYHEHFGVDANENPPDFFEPGYREGMAWKRQLHETLGTILVETTSYSIRRPDGFLQLREDLELYGVKFGARPLTEEQRQKLIEDGSLLRTFRTFLAHTKSNRLTMDDLRDRARMGKSEHPDRDRLFLSLFKEIWDEWDQRLREGNYVDFEDMLCLAVDQLAADRCSMPYRLIMADEFQGTSRVRGALLKQLSKADDARLFVVGDDWQAVNKFAGADISLMQDFGRIFGSQTTTYLTRTFRCPADLCEISSKFICKNPFQIKKAVRSTNPRTLPSLICFKLDDMSTQSVVLHRHIGKLAEKLRNEGDSATAYILGRYKTDWPSNFSRIQAEVDDVLDLTYSTIHRAKGLEADYVFLVNAIEATKGLPSKMEDDASLWIAMPEGEDFPFAEERRLFYVALTRARKMVSLYTDLRRRSEFIAELERDGAPLELRVADVGSENSRDVRECPECGNGVLTPKRGQFGPFTGCSRFPRCGFTEHIVRRCPECGDGILIVKDGRYGKFVACNRFPRCEYRERRPNRSGYS